LKTLSFAITIGFNQLSCNQLSCNQIQLQSTLNCKQNQLQFNLFY